MKQLTQEAREVLRRICMAYAAMPFEAGKEERLRPPNLCRAEQRLAMNELLTDGLLEVRQKMWGEKLYQIPVERLPLLQSGFFSYQPQFVEGYEIKLTMEAGAGLTGDLFRALLYIAREGLPLTIKGSIHKKNIGRLNAQLSCQERHLEGLFISSPYLETYPVPAAVVVDLMLYLGLISERGAAYELEMEALQQWFHLSESGMAAILYTVVINRYGSLKPADQHFRYLISSSSFQSQKWTTLSGIMDWMVNTHLVAPEMRTELEISSLSWLRILAGFGWCELGAKPDGDHCFRWSGPQPQLIDETSDFLDLGIQVTSSTPMFIVQPDFEVLVPPEVSYAIRWTLAGCAELLQSDTLWSFRLTRERLESAAEQGISPEEAIFWLNAHALGQLPNEVEFALKQWGRGIGRTALAEVILLSCRSEEEGDAIAAHPRLQENLTRLGPHHFSVREEGLEQVRRELSAAGMAPPRSIAGRLEATVADKVFLHLPSPESSIGYTLPPLHSERGLFRTGNPDRYLQPAPLNSQEDSLPGIESVPTMWSREWRHYHSTTAQKIMEQALSWGIKVRLSLQGESCDFIPVQVSGNPWRVSGLKLSSRTEEVEEIELTAGDWKEMRLVIPSAQRNSSSA
ncbi:helicase-associated domain-containing protein [Paenibacillus sp. 19GGS1-52]|uniref:helicase-associated domain-containing protein n=1 Tax=Paenibacillus sp. 19GGS1-52 TaxID=2758563 RepID=UPI001EFAACD5|nr:helicase-associated domain-containing protein [Paenibacillus sp. 19GGS1-52]ULO05418.1 helicase-associated domain-containing protein [Paenibacillus sp. 19GGS1-52]